MKPKCLFVFGTLPEFIKVYPVIQEAKKKGNEVTIINTGQHKEMLDNLFSFFDFTPGYNLKIIDQSNGLTEILTSTLTGLDPIFKKEKPDIVFVHGDTPATLYGSIAAFYHKIKIAHFEAGLRTYNKYSSFPEEMNRQLTGVSTDYHFTSTETTKKNLLREGKSEDSIFVIGNNVIDTLKYTIKKAYKYPILTNLHGKKLILITAHRRENLDELSSIFKAINSLAEKYHDTCEFVYPIHMNPIIREKAAVYLKANNITIVEPLNTIDFHNIMSHAYLILTDSGGMQEEAPALRIPVLVLRDTTERPEGVTSGTLKLIGTKEQDIIDGVTELIDDSQRYEEMKTVKNPYGDGTTAEKIMEIINE